MWLKQNDERARKCDNFGEIMDCLESCMLCVFYFVFWSEDIVFMGDFFERSKLTEISRYKLQQIYEITSRGFKLQ